MQLWEGRGKPGFWGNFNFQDSREGGTLVMTDNQGE